MLSQIRIKNFRCYEDHTVNFKPISIVVGQNNSGKSTLIEALRLVSIIVDRYKGLNYTAPPKWLDLPLGTKGVMPSLKNTGINFLSIFHLLGDPPGEIEAVFECKNSIKFYIGPNEQVFALVTDRKGNYISSKHQAGKINIPFMATLPQIGPLQREERILSSDYIYGSTGSTLTSLHFRNQLYFFSDYFDEFKEFAESSWPGLIIDTLDADRGWPGDLISLFVRDGKFEGEVGWMGHGLQMWLQIIWFLVLYSDHHSIILDEPDVYMHPDLQRILFRLIRNKFPQLIIATHSTEIIAEANADEILLINKDSGNSKFASSLPAVQEIVEKVGSIHNLHLTRLWHSSRFLMVEGDDVDFLKHFQNIIFPDSLIPIKTIPQSPINGRGGWSEARGLSKTIKNAGGKRIKTYCILDRDYHSREEIDKKIKESKERDINLHIWSKKEIENFLLVPSAIQRLISSRCSQKVVPPVETEIIEEIERLAESYKDYVFDQISNEIFICNKSNGLSNANIKAREYVNKMWETQEGRFSIIPGKRLISGLSSWSQKEYKVSLSTSSLACTISLDELHEEIIFVLTAIEDLRSF